jgi:hypothetical protein
MLYSPLQNICVRPHLYDKIKEEKQFRLEWGEKCEIGFGLPEFGLSTVPKVPNVPKSEDMGLAACAA